MKGGGMALVRKLYGVPARRGGRVRYTGDGRAELGTITSAKGARVRIRLDGWRMALPFHPTWCLEYLEPTAKRPGKARP